MANAAQRRAYLQAMGVQAWVRRAVDASLAESDAVNVAAPVVPEAVTATAPAVPAAPPVAVETPVKLPVEPPRLENSELTSPAVVTAETPAPVTPPPAEPEAAVGTLDWQALQAAVMSCSRCGLHASRSQAVFGSGNRRAEWMIVGEAPGEDEDQQGEPFVGASGQLLNNMLRATGLSREQVYLTNAIKCHPPKDRNPHVDEVSQCFGYLQRQIALLQPRVILAVGRVAAHALLKVNTPLGELRGQVHAFADTPLVVTYHPAYLLRKPFEKAKSWDDLRLARRLVAEAQA